MNWQSAHHRCLPSFHLFCRCKGGGWVYAPMPLYPRPINLLLVLQAPPSHNDIRAYVNSGAEFQESGCDLPPVVSVWKRCEWATGLEERRAS